MPSFISLTSEYCPRRLRAVIVALLWAGFPLGGFVGGLLASWIIPAYGWHSVFWVGGVLPLLVCIVLIFALPESVGFLVASAAPAERIASLLRQMFPSASVPAGATFVLNEERARGVPVVQALRHRPRRRHRASLDQLFHRPHDAGDQLGLGAKASASRTPRSPWRCSISAASSRRPLPAG
jgi:hypothetical protein